MYGYKPECLEREDLRYSGIALVHSVYKYLKEHIGLDLEVVVESHCIPGPRIATELAISITNCRT